MINYVSMLYTDITDFSVKTNLQGGLHMTQKMVEYLPRLLFQHMSLGKPLVHCTVVFYDDDGRTEDDVQVFVRAGSYQVVVCHRTGTPGSWSWSYYEPDDLLGSNPKIKILVPEGTKIGC